MNNTIKNILAVIAGLLIGSAANMGIIQIGPSIIPYPEGYDMTSMEGMAATFHLLEIKHLMMPFVAHAIGTFVGAFIAVLIAGSHQLKLALVISGLFFMGGAMMVVMLPQTPVWFSVLDLVVAYVPMAWFGYKFATIVKP